MTVSLQIKNFQAVIKYDDNNPMLYPMYQMLYPMYEMLCPMYQMLCPMYQMLYPMNQMLYPMYEMLCPMYQMLYPMYQILCCSFLFFFSRLFVKLSLLLLSSICNVMITTLMTKTLFKMKTYRHPDVNVLYTKG